MSSKNTTYEKNMNQEASKVYLGNVKNNFMLKKIFDCIERVKSLLIIKCNKKLQKRLNISINDYKEYSQSFSTIEIELKPPSNKFGDFINIPDKDKEYYHIYFDNSTEEIKRNLLYRYEYVKTINIKIDHQVTSFKKLFENCDCIDSIFFKKFTRNNITDMSYMFYNCIPLKELNFSNFNTSNVINMSYMFEGCSSLEELNLSDFNTINVTNMSYMFYKCPLLKKVNLSNFNTINLKDMSFMFNECTSLEELNLSNFNTSNVTNMDNMFSGCKLLKVLNISNFNTNNLTNMSLMFFGCSSLKELSINFSNFNIKKVANKSKMFYGCPDELKKKIKENLKSVKN